MEDWTAGQGRVSKHRFGDIVSFDSGRIKSLLILVMLLLWGGLATPSAAQMMESFEDWSLTPGQTAPAGWLKWEEAGGRGWSNTWVGRQPMPGWMSGTNEAPPDADAGSRMAYVTYTHGGSKTNDLWLITPTLKGIVATSTVSFWYRSCFSNFADSIRVQISTNTSAYRKSDFTIPAFQHNFPRNWPNNCAPTAKCDFPPWSNIVVNIGSMVPAGTEIRLGFQEYYNNNWYDVGANEMDVVRSDLWSEPVLTTYEVRLIDPTTVEVDYYAFPGYPTSQCYMGWAPDPDAMRPYQAVKLAPGSNTCVISNLPAAQTLFVRPFTDHSRAGRIVGEALEIRPGDSEGEGYLLESFEEVPIIPGDMPPAGWLKWQEAGGRGWSNSWAGRQPLPGWMSGTNSVPPDPDAGSRLAYVTYTHGGSKTNDLWLISPTIKNVPSNYPVSFWYRSCFSNFADTIRLQVSENPNATRKSDFSITAYQHTYPRNWPNNCAPTAKCDFPPWTNIIVDVGALVTPGSDIRLGFQEYYNNNWYDVRANELDVIRAGSPVRNALHFDGVDDGIDLPLTNHPTAYTIEAWVKPEATGAMNILAETTTNYLANYNRQLRLTAGGVFEHYGWDGAVKTVTGSTVVQTGQWYHVCGTAQDGGTMRLVVNGVEEGTAASIGTLQHGANDRMTVARATGGGSGFFNGWIDEVRTWTDVRTDDENLDSMNLYLRGIEDDLESCYRFDSTWGSDLFDSSQGGNDGWFGPAVDSYTWTHEARLYDGIDDFDVLPQSSSPPMDYTLEAWIRPQSTGARNILVLTDGDATTSYNRQLRINSSGYLEFYSFDGGTRLVTGTSVLPSNQWTHVAGTAASGGTMRLYVNGVEEDNGPAGVTLFATSRVYQVAAEACWSPRYAWFKGRIRDVGITNRVKSAAELVATVSDATGYAINESPQWGAAETPLGDAVASQQWKNRGIWEMRTASGASRGLRLVSSGLVGLTNFFVFGDNNQTGSTNTDLAVGLAEGRLTRVWHMDVHGQTQQVANLIFDPVVAGSSGVLSSTNDYLLLRRDGTSGNFAVVRTHADAITVGEVVFNTLGFDEGYYTLGVTAPRAPAPLAATNFTAVSFHANWSAVADITGYQLDVSTDAGFGSFVAGYQDLAVGDVVTASVTGLLPGMTYHFRLRSERDGIFSTNSVTQSATTLTEGAIGIDPLVLDFSCIYGSNPADQTLVLTNSGQTAYTFANAITYSAGASGWLNAMGGSIASNASLVQTAQVTAASINVGTYIATNSMVSGTATNSPQAQLVTLTISKADQSITFPVIPAQLTTDGVGLSSTAGSGLSVIYTVFSGPASIAGGTNLSFTGAGNVSIVASQAGDGNWNAAVQVTNTFAVSKAVAAVTLGSLAQQYNGTPRVATAGTVPGGLTVNLTYDGSATAPTVVGSYAVTGVVSDVMYQGSDNGTLVVSKGDQTLTFPAIGDKVTTDAVGLSATASSGLGVSFGVSVGPASIAGGTNLTFSTSGQVSIVAAQVGDGNWNAAPDVTNTFNVTKAASTVHLAGLSQVYDGTSRTVTATTMPAGLTVEITYDGAAAAPTNAATYAVTGTVNDLIYQGSAADSLVVTRALDTITFSDTNHVYDGTAKTATAVAGSGSPVALTYDGAVPAPVNAGTVVVTGIVDAVNWEATNTTVLTIAKADQTITFAPLSNQVTTNEVGLAATSGSGLTVSFAVDSGSASITGGTNLTFTGEGSVSIVASQSGDTNWNGAASVTNTFTVTKAVAPVVLQDLAQIYDGTVRTITATTMPAGLTVEFTYDGASTAPSNTGTYAVTGNVQDVMYQGVSTGSLIVAKADQTITFAAILDQLTTDSVGLSAAAGSGIPVFFAVASGPAAISGGTNLTFSTSGQVSLVASQAGNSNWNAAPDVTNTFAVTKDAAPVFLLDLAQTYDGTVRTITATTMPAGLTVEFTYNGSSTAPTDAGTVAVTGTVQDLVYQGIASSSLVVARALDTITFSNTNHVYDGTAKAATAVAGSGSTVDLTYDGAAAAPVNVGTVAVTGVVDVLNWEATNTATLTIIQADQVITFSAMADQETTNEVGLSATSGSGLTVSFAVGSGPASIAGGTNLTFTGEGSVSIIGTQAGDTNWNAAPDVTNTFQVAKAVAPVVLLDLAQTYNGMARTITATTMPAGLTVEVTYDGGSAAPSNAGTYAVTGTVNDLMYQGVASDSLVVAKTNQMITFPAILHQLTTDAVGLAATASSGFPVSFAVASGPASIAGGTNLTFSTSGQVSIAASQAGDSDWTAAPDVTNTFTVSKASSSVFLLDLAQTYDGALRTVTATTMPAGLTVDFTYNGSTTTPSNAGSYAVTGMVNDLVYQGSSTGLLEVSKGTQMSNYPAISNQFTTNVVDLWMTADSGLPVTWTILSGPATNASGSNLTFTGTGEVQVTASQPGDANWLSFSHPYVFDVLKHSQTLTTLMISNQFTTNVVDLTPVVASSGLPVDWSILSGPAVLAGETNVSFTGVGTVRLQVNQPGDFAYYPSINYEYQFDVVKHSQTLTPIAISNQLTTNVVDLTGVTASSGLPVDWSVLSGPAVLAGETNVSFIGAGTVRLQVNQPGDFAYYPSINDEYQFYVDKAVALVTLHSLSQTYDGTPRIVTATTAPTGLTVNITYDGAAPAPTHANSYTVVGTISDVIYQGGATGTLVVIKGDQVITNFLPADGTQFIMGTTAAMSAQAWSGLPASFSIGGPVTVTGGTNLLFTGPGTVTATASQPGNTNWNAALPVVNEWRVTGLITNVEPGAANVGGGLEVLIQGLSLGNGNDITNIMLAGVEADIVTQAVHEVTVLAAATDVASTGDVTVISTTSGTMVRTNAFEYLWLAPPVQLDPADIKPSSLWARWQNSTGATAHLLDVAYDTNFSSYVAGYNGLDVGLAEEHQVTGLDWGTTYAIRLFAWNASGFSLPSRTVWVATTLSIDGDFDGDSLSDPVVFEPSDAVWDGVLSTGAPWTFPPWGRRETVPVVADYDGDGITDFALYEAASGCWYIVMSAGGSRKVQFGWSTTIPLPGDYDGDGLADLCFFHAEQGRWYFQCTTAGDYTVQFGWKTMIPVPADYDGDGMTDIALYHRASATWFILRSSDGSVVRTEFGWDTTVPVPGDYDGDGMTDIAILNRPTSKWCILFSGGGGEIVQFGYKTMTPVAADYDGDDVTDIAMYHQASGTWYIRESSTGTHRVVSLGGPEAIPVLLIPMIHAWYGLP